MPNHVKGGFRPPRSKVGSCLPSPTNEQTHRDVGRTPERFNGEGTSNAPFELSSDSDIEAIDSPPSKKCKAVTSGPTEKAVSQLNRDERQRHNSSESIVAWREAAAATQVALPRSREHTPRPLDKGKQKASTSSPVTSSHPSRPSKPPKSLSPTIGTGQQPGYPPAAITAAMIRLGEERCNKLGVVVPWVEVVEGESADDVHAVSGWLQGVASGALACAIDAAFRR